MGMAEQFSEKNNTYIWDAESAAEMGRLLLQDRKVTEAMGGPLAECTAPSTIWKVLDIGCGPGGWALALADHYRHMDVTGIDISELMVAYARSEAVRRDLDNAHFEVMSALEPLKFADRTFNLVNTRYATSFVSRTAWPVLIQECARVLRTGGTIRITETDTFALTNSPAFEQYQRMVLLLLFKLGYGMSPDGSSFGITPMLASLLNEAGFRNIKHRPHIVDGSAGASAHESFRRNAAVAFKGLQDPLVKMNFVTQNEVIRLYNEVLQEMQRPDFRGVSYLLTVWGEK